MFEPDPTDTHTTALRREKYPQASLQNPLTMDEAGRQARLFYLSKKKDEIKVDGAKLDVGALLPLPQSRDTYNPSATFVTVDSTPLDVFVFIKGLAFGALEGRKKKLSHF